MIVTSIAAGVKRKVYKMVERPAIICYLKTGGRAGGGRIKYVNIVSGSDPEGQDYKLVYQRDRVSSLGIVDIQDKKKF